nr:FAD-dependent oxidoreductase [Herbiconiux sp.]
MGLRDEFLTIPHSEVRTLDVVVNGTRIHAVDFGALPAPDDFLAFMPQWDFLNFLAAKAQEFPTFDLRMSTSATGVRRAGAAVTGVTATDAAGDVEIRAGLTIAADGRTSTVRAATGLKPREFGIPIDVLWFALPKPASLPPSTLAYIDHGSFVLTIDRRDHYQAGAVIPKGHFEQIRREGLDAFRHRLAQAARPLASVVGALESWDQVKLLSVQVSRLEQWHRPGLLCIGDSAHAMSPAFGVGVNYAIQDAVATANTLVEALREGRDGIVPERMLAAVQHRRLPPVRAMQAVQLRLHRAIARPVEKPLLANPPTAGQRAALRVIVPTIRRVAPWLLGKGFRPETISEVVAGPQ